MRRRYEHHEGRAAKHRIGTGNCRRLETSDDAEPSHSLVTLNNVIEAEISATFARRPWHQQYQLEQRREQQTDSPLHATDSTAFWCSVLEDRTEKLAEDPPDSDGNDFSQSWWRSARHKASPGSRSQQLRTTIRLRCMLLLLLLLLLFLVLHWGICATSLASASQIVNDGDPESVIIKSHQDQLFRGLRLAANQTTSAPPKGDVVAFLGVRYASAPVKRLRFMPPTPFNYAKQATGNQSQAHDMRQFGPICMQRFPMDPTREQAWPTQEFGQTATSGPSAGPVDWRTLRSDIQLGLMERLLAPGLYHSWRPIVRKLTRRFVQSEDCLNLNIYTPIEALKREQHQETDSATGQADDALPNATTASDRERPVLVVIHGDSFDFGSGSALDGRGFAQNNRVVVITLNYRLHMLGFPPRPTSASRGNLGLLDQVAALHWIQANVRSFGGSPTKITLMGSKVGAIFVHLLMLSPLAKGLFQRVILEDGTALSPVIANNMALAGSLSSNHQRQQQQHVAAGQQHLRILAQLNDCPVGRVANSSLQQQQQQQTTLSLEEERASWALTIECLKTKPAESIMRHLPVELIDTSRPVSSAAIPLAPRWLRPLEQALDLLIKEELKLRLDDNDLNTNTTAADLNQSDLNSRRYQLEELKRMLATASADQTTPLLAAHHLNRLTGLMINRFLLHSAPGTATKLSNQEDGKLVALLSELLGAIYLPSNKTLPVGPVFTPQLEPGLILASSSSAELDLASSMLQRSSPFGRRDLLIGLTHPLVDFDAEEPAASSKRHQQRSAAAAACGLQLVPSLASRRLIDFGLTEEQAIGQVNLFVRSFYRYHQQEISNSIISQYLSKKSNLVVLPLDVRPGSRLEEGLNALTAAAMASDRQHDARLQKQLFLAEAMRTLHQDSLIDVPLIKTCVIHSLQQLESLADLFIAQQLNKLEAQQLNEEHNDEELEQAINEKRLEEEFHRFAQGFYQNPALWPIRLMPAQRAQDSNSRELFEQRQPHSTYLFQFNNKLDWSQRLRAAIERLDSRTRRLASSSAISSAVGVRAILVGMIEELQGDAKEGRLTAVDTNRKLTGCSFIDALDKVDQNPDDDADGRGATFDRFKRWICRRRIEGKLANFVKTGNVNLGPASMQESQSRQANSREMLERRFELECGPQEQLQSSRSHDVTAITVQNDHHLVQLVGGGSSNRTNFESSSWWCGRRLEELAFEELLGESEPTGRNEWSVFNVFTQQLASLFASNNDPNDWSMDSFISSVSANSQLRESFDGKMNFWANFVTALNCSKTQPIGASSLSLFSQANSTLLNINLNLNCQQAGTRTANSVLLSMGSRIKQELVQQVCAWRRARARSQSRSQLVANLSASSHNHHSLRMASMNNSQDQQQQQTSLLESGGNAESSPASSNPAGHPFTGWLTVVDTTNGAQRKLFHQQTSVAFWLLGCGALLVLSVVVASGFVALRRHWRQKRCRAAARPDESGRVDGEDPLSWNSTGLQTDTGGPLSEPSGQKLTAGGEVATSQSHQPASFVEYHNGELEAPSYQQRQLDDLGQFAASSANSSRQCVGGHQHPLGNKVVGTDLVANRHTHFMQPETDFGGQNGSCHSTVLSGAAQVGQDHLPANNPVFMHQQQQRQLLSSSSETTTTTQPAQSSVSLVSGSTILKRPANKKRVKISDPKRLDIPGSLEHSMLAYHHGGGGKHQEEPLVELAPHQLHQLFGGASQHNFCPIHRSSSHLNMAIQPGNAAGGQFIIDDATKFQLINGHHSLMRHYHHQHGSGSQRAMTVDGNYQEEGACTYNGQQEVSTAHNIEQRHHQRQQMIFANGLYQRQSVKTEAPQR